MKITPPPATLFPASPPDDPADDQEALFDEPEPVDDGNRDHVWVVAATIEVPQKVAKHSFLRGSFRTAADQRIDALEVYCGGCRRPYDEVADAECEAKIDNTHLIGGEPGTRKKRKTYEPEGQWVPAPPIERRGIESLVFGDG